MKRRLEELTRSIAPCLGRPEYGNLRLVYAGHAPTRKERLPGSYLLFAYEHFLDSTTIAGIGLESGLWGRSSMISMLGERLSQEQAIVQLHDELIHIPNIRLYQLKTHYEDACRQVEERGLDLADFYAAAELARLRRSTSQAA